MTVMILSLSGLRLAALATAHGIIPVFASQPALYRKTGPSLIADVNWLCSIKLDGKGYRLSEQTIAEVLDGLNQTLLTTCKKEGFAGVDLAATFPADVACFYDPVHFTEKGAAAVAEALLPAVLSSLPRDP